MKTCPYCAEMIQDDAVKCRYCGSVLMPGATASGYHGAERSAAPEQLPWTTIGIAVLAIVAIVALGIGAGLLARWRHASAQQSAAATVTPTQDQPYSFGVPWGTPPDTVSMQLMGRGLSFTEHDEDGDQVYSGVVDGSQAVVLAMFARGGLAKVIVAYTAPADPQAAYASIVERLTKRYGAPATTSPAGSGRPVTSWPPRRDATGDTRVWATITDTHDVAVHYESGGWRAEADRRKGASS